ncbi:SigE family RNA polymerase sigma factor [Ornithinicoccus hortensis]|uniref:RNA polymerase sigma-70 factor (Sigma-E family) n=1 Tax=Ornithinicoccus hortensis TaxID=82346 RepID=A0A542YWG4_9MICO|nr:SigE family RNA polymerase sigma factor [Ornithinicoccus hortensis]TQL52438.1 RNA polymerase sigma-70 factor (sigma-E family) [Ornithinicoccus hortensis]
MRRSKEFTAFVDARYASMLRAAILFTGNRHTAEDLLQEALLRTFDSWHRLEVIGAAESYTRTTMVRLLVRDRRRRWSGEVPTEHLPDSDPERETRSLDDRVASVVSVRAALRELPVDQRVVLVLRYYEDLSVAEIARVLGCREGTVKSRASRGMQALRDSSVLSEDETTVSGWTADAERREAGAGLRGLFGRGGADR